jgi:hypothetical protein
MIVSNHRIFIKSAKEEKLKKRKIGIKKIQRS